MNPLLLTDYYKTEHHKMYPEGTTMIYSNLTPRKSRMKGVDNIVFFGLQHFIKTTLIDGFNANFFMFERDENGKIEDSETAPMIGGMSLVDMVKKSMIAAYKKHVPVDTKHIEDLWDLGYLPLEIKALPEGTVVPIGVPVLTIRNTHPQFYWLTNYLETLMSAMMWQPSTSATIAYEYKKLLTKYAKETGGDLSFVDWQGHDFSFRGMSSVESGILSGMGHLTSFTGTDTIPAIYQLESSYNATGLIGASVPATEHSVMSMGTKDDEIGTFKALLDKYPTGILSVVSDTWDLWKVATEYLPTLKDQIMARDGKLVIRPDSGDPVDIICGNQTNPKSELEQAGLIEILWRTFEGTVNDKGYKQLDSHIGAIYGDSITLDRAKQICERLKAKGFASTNVVLGIGSYTYQYNTRDTFGFAVKATYGEVNGVGRELFKDPITDDGTKRSKKGLLCVRRNMDGKLIVLDQVTKESEGSSDLKTVFLNGKLIRETTLDEIRERLKNQMP